MALCEVIRLIGHNWKKEDYVALSVYAAKLCLRTDEPEAHKAIEVTERWLKSPTEYNLEETKFIAKSLKRLGHCSWSGRTAEVAAWSPSVKIPRNSAECAVINSISSFRYDNVLKDKIEKQINQWIEERTLIKSQ